MLFLLMVPAEKRLIVFTEKDMFEFWQTEKASGRVPGEIEFLLISLPEELSERLVKARRAASEEVSPKH